MRAILSKNFPNLGVTPFPFFCMNRRTKMDMNRLNHSTSSLAKGIMDLGIKKHERVLTYMWNSINLVELYYGLPRGGAVCVFTNPAYTPRELNHMLTDSKARAIVTDLDLYERSKVLYDNLPHLEYTSSRQVGRWQKIWI
jgi:long-chain acyl-CoA synthetase